MGDLAGMDIRRAPIEELRQARGWRKPERDFWADEAAMWARFTSLWEGLDDAAWLEPVAKSEAGGPDWTFLDHVAHLAAWQDMAVDYIGSAADTGVWPTDEEVVGGDFDRFNEGQRAEWAGRSPEEVRAWAVDSRERLLPVARKVPLETIRGEDAWGWVFLSLHGHQLDHLGLLEPWLARRRVAS